MLRFVATICASALLLTGCGMFNAAPPAPPGCQASFQAGGSWKIGSLSIPMGSLAPGQKFSLNGVEYNADQIKQLSEASQRLEQVRLTGCAVLYAPGISQDKKDKAADSIAAAMTAMLTFGAQVAAAQTPEQAVAAAKEASQGAQDAAKSLPPVKTPPASQSEYLDQLREQMAMASRRSDARTEQLALAVKELGAKLSALETPSSKSFILAGFTAGSDSLPSDRLGDLAHWFTQALNATAPAVKPTVLIVGYTDSSGTLTKNLNLSLRRAIRVREFLNAQVTVRPFDAQISAGGVLGPDKNSRSVRVIVS